MKMVASKRFKVKHVGDWYHVNAGEIAGKYYAAMTLMHKIEADAIADARNRLVLKKASITRRVRKTRKEA